MIRPARAMSLADFFLGYEGYLQADGYGGYNGLEKQNGLIRIGCNMHGRRKFFDAAEGSSKGQSLAKDGLQFYKELYEIEEVAREYTYSERFIYRVKHAVPIWAKMKAWAESNRNAVPPKSKIGQAYHYFIEQFELLKGYLQHGMLEMDNGFAERSIRKFAIGRNNWLFSDSVGGAKASSLFYSLVVTAKINGVNPYAALEKIFTEIPLAKSIDDYERIAASLFTPTMQ